MAPYGEHEVMRGTAANDDGHTPPGVPGRQSPGVCPRSCHPPLVHVASSLQLGSTLVPHSHVRHVGVVDGSHEGAHAAPCAGGDDGHGDRPEPLPLVDPPLLDPPLVDPPLLDPPLLEPPLVDPPLLDPPLLPELPPPPELDVPPSSDPLLTAPPHASAPSARTVTAALFMTAPRKQTPAGILEGFSHMRAGPAAAFVERTFLDTRGETRFIPRDDEGA